MKDTVEADQHEGPPPPQHRRTLSGHLTEESYSRYEAEVRTPSSTGRALGTGAAPCQISRQPVA